MAKDFSSIDTYTTINNVSGNTFNANIQIYGDTKIILMKENISSNITNQILNIVQNDISTISNYSTVFLNPLFNAQYLKIKNLLYSNSGLKIQDFIDYSLQKIELSSVNNETYIQIVNNPLYNTELTNLKLLISNLKTFIININSNTEKFNNYFKIFNIYNNFFDIFTKYFYSSSYKDYSTQHILFTQELVNIFSYIGQLYFDKNSSDVIEIDSSFYSISKITNNTYSFNFNNIILPANTAVKICNVANNFTESKYNKVNNDNVFVKANIVSNLQNKNIINSVIANEVDFTTVQVSKDTVSSYCLKYNNKKIGKADNSKKTVPSQDNSIINTIAMSNLNSRILLLGQDPRLPSNLNYYDRDYINNNVNRYDIGSIRLSNLDLDNILPNKYVRVKQQIVNITDFETLYRQCVTNVSFTINSINSIKDISYDESLFTQKYQYSNNIFVGAKMLINNTVATITGINAGIVTFDINILQTDTILMIQNPFLKFITSSTMQILTPSAENLPVSFIFNQNINSANTNQEITLQPNQTPSFQYVGWNKSFHGDVQANPEVFPGANASPGIFIRKTESAISNNLLSGNIGNLSPLPISTKQKTAIMYKLYIKYE